METTKAEDQDNATMSCDPNWDGPPVKNMSIGDVLWDFDQLKVPLLWSQYGVRGENVNAYVIDSGCNTKHHSFAHHSRVKAHSFIRGNPDPEDGNGHGTWCCGKIAGQGVGIAPRCNLTSLRSLDDNGSGYSYYTTAALEYIKSEPDPHIVNMSLGSFSSSEASAKACKDLYDRGCLVIAAAGNEDTSRNSYPAAYDGVLAVAAYDIGQDRAWFSNYGDHIAIAAPGVSCYSTHLGSDFRRLQGTSMASPTVAGLLTLGASYLLKKNPSIGRATMRDILIKALQTSAIDLGKVGKDQYYGYGGLNGQGFMAELAKTV